MNETLLTIIVVVVITAILIYITMKKRNSSWKGILEDKKVKSYSDEDGYSKESYILIFKNDLGKKVKMSVNKKMYEQFEVGKRYTKEKGSFLPKAE